MVTNVEISARPVTGAQQGMSGMKTAGQGPGRQVTHPAATLPHSRLSHGAVEFRLGSVSLGCCSLWCGVSQVADKSYFLNNLRQKIQEINAGEPALPLAPLPTLLHNALLSLTLTLTLSPLCCFFAFRRNGEAAG